MTVVRGRTNQYGPGTVDIQLEQGADFSLSLALKLGEAVWDVTDVTFAAHLSTEWGPGGQCVPMVVEKVDAAQGQIRVTLLSATVDPLASPLSPPARKTSNPRVHKLGGWVLNYTVAGVPRRLLSGDVQWERDPCQM